MRGSLPLDMPPALCGRPPGHRTGCGSHEDTQPKDGWRLKSIPSFASLAESPKEGRIFLTRLKSSVLVDLIV